MQKNDSEKYPLLQNPKNNNSNILKIKDVIIKSKVILAPMAGITDSVLRKLVRKYSPNCLVMSEMVSSEALLMNKENAIIKHEKSEYPLSFQLSGHKIDIMKKAAKKLEEIATTIDINMGCPAPKIVKNGDGSALMQNIPLAKDLVKALKDTVDVPITVKTRLGWDIPSMNYLEFSLAMQEAGADAIMIHGRTRSQMYSGNADWEKIAEIKKELHIPTIANGDIVDIDSAKKCLDITKCDGIAIGRGILGDVELISRIEHFLETGETTPPPNIYRRIELLKAHLEQEMSLRGELFGIKFMRKFFAYYIKNIKGASNYRYELVRATDKETIYKILSEIHE